MNDNLINIYEAHVQQESAQFLGLFVDYGYCVNETLAGISHSKIHRV